MSLADILNKKSRLRWLSDSMAETLKTALETEAVYFRNVPAKQAPPFVVFLLDQTGREGDIRIFDVTLEVSGYVGQAAQVEAIMDEIEDVLDAYSYTDDNQSWQCWVRSSGYVDSTDPELTRRRLQLDLRYLERSTNYES